MKKLSLILTVLLLFFCFTSEAQTLVNQTVDTTGQPSHIYEYTKFVSIGGGNVVGIDNDYNSAFDPSNEGFHIAEGNDTLGFFAGFDFFGLYGQGNFGTNLYVRNGSLYVVGFTTDSTLATALSCLLIKINIATFDTVWTASIRIDSAVQQMPFSVLADDSGYIYMGASVQTPSDYKMALLKFDSNGHQIWQSSYDTVGLYTIPVAMAFSGSGNQIAVTGFSFDGIGNSNFVTADFLTSTGHMYGYKTSTNGIGRVSHPVGILPDSLGNNYVGGTSTVAGTNSVIKVVAYDSLFNQVWVSTWGDSTKSNQAVAMFTGMPRTPSNHILITGNSPNSNGGTDMVTLRYNLDGTLRWSARLSAPNPANGASGVSIANDINDHTIVTGTVFNGTDTNVMTASYDTSGNLLWMKTFARTSSSNDVPYSINIGDNGVTVYVTAKSVGSDSLYLMLRYDQLTLPKSIVSDSMANPQYIDNEIMVRFNPTILDPAFINNLDKHFTPIDLVVADSIIVILSNKCGVDLHGAILSKILTGMTQKDSISITRGGDTIVVPKFWASLILTNISLGDLTLESVKNSLDGVSPYIFYTDFNHIGIFDCDGSGTSNHDPQFNTQFALSDALHSDDINWCPAFTNGVVGSGSIKIGIYDSGVNSTHEDLQFGGVTKILGGTDYTVSTSTPILSTPNSDLFGHGTAMTGIIGAQTQNGKGVAGVAGGNATSSGCALYCDKIGSGAPSITTSTLYYALIHDASSTGLGLNIINHSYHYSVGDKFMHDAFRFAARSGVVNACSTGDYGLAEALYPSGFNNLGFTIRVGANDTTGDWASFSDYGFGVDLVAPGAHDQYKVLSNTSNTGYSDSVSIYLVDGTSFSTAYVSGASGLIMSSANAITPLGNVPLAPEDVREILKLEATPLSNSTYTGAGRLNIGQALSEINYPKYKIRHYIVKDSTDATAIETTNQTVNLTWSYEIDPHSATPILQTGRYTADIYKIALTVPYSIPSSERIITAWPLPNQSDFWGPKHTSLITTYDLDPDPLPTLTLNTGTVTMTGYVYHFTANSAGAIDVWAPFPIDSALGYKMAFSIWTNDTTISGISEVKQNKLTAVIYPSPTSDLLNLDYYLPEASDLQIRILDINGRTEMIDQIKENIGAHTYRFNIAALSAGMYFCEINTGDNKFIGKFIKE